MNNIPSGMDGTSDERKILSKIRDRSLTVGVVGLGYVGLPLAMAIARAGYKTVGFDVDPAKKIMLDKGMSYIGAVSNSELNLYISSGGFAATTDMEKLRDCDLIVICVPTPLTRHREPDMTYVIATARTIAEVLRIGHVVVLESTTYPGTTVELLKPILEANGLKSGNEFFIGFSPEREDPGNLEFQTVTIPKVVAGDGDGALRILTAFYSSVVERVVPVSSPATAEAVKITENIFRSVNIALVNELKVIYEQMGIDIWEVIDAAKTKPFGYMPFYPGPGLGGHCIPIDPFYLTWKSREFDINTRFIELAGEINASMPRYVACRLETALDVKMGLSLSKARILILGLAYKKNVSDIRESPALKFMELIEERGSRCDYTDPHVPVIPQTREYGDLAGRVSVDITSSVIAAYDAVVVMTDHDIFNYGAFAERSRLIIDTRNVFGRNGYHGINIVKA